MSFDLFQLVPAVYRLRDAQIAASMQLLSPAEQTLLSSLQTSTTPLNATQQSELDALFAKSQRGPLQSLVMVIAEQLQAFAADLDQLYDDQFIETCAPWVIPYIGDLIGYQSIRGIAPTVDNPRSEVANTIAFRRRKGTVLVLEELARDVTGWGAHAVEFFEILADTQYMKHVRRFNHYAPNVRGWQPRFYRNSGFSQMPRKVDVRNFGQAGNQATGLPRPNVQNIGIYLWSLGAYSVTSGTPTVSTASPNCYRFSALGMDQPLFHAAISQGDPITAPATPANVPDRLPRLVLCADMQKGVGTDYYGIGASLALYQSGQLLNPYQLQVADLSGPDGSWNNLPAATSPYAALIDPDLGRIALPPVAAGQSQPPLAVSYYYGFNAPMGGGEYEREPTFLVTNEEWIVQCGAAPLPSIPAALTQALSLFSSEGQIAIEIQDSETYVLASPLAIDLPAGVTLEFRARDGARPTLLLSSELTVTGDQGSTLILSGLVIAAGAAMSPGAGSSALVHVPSTRPSASPNLLGTLNLTHTTLVPGWSVKTDGEPVYPDAPAILIEASGVAVQSSLAILGAIQATNLATVTLADSIVDATALDKVAYAAPNGASLSTPGGAPLTLTGCTVVGKVHAHELVLVSDSVLWAITSNAWPSGLVSDRLQAGCVRFSFLPINAVTPRRFQCVEQALAMPTPLFIATRYGDPGYLKMLACTDPTIRRGADDGGEMGAFHFLLAPQRESDLTIRLEEYTPVGLQIGLIYQT
jgi:hypothetical protein